VANGGAGITCAEMKQSPLQNPPLLLNLHRRTEIACGHLLHQFSHGLLRIVAFLSLSTSHLRFTCRWGSTGIPWLSANSPQSSWRAVAVAAFQRKWWRARAARHGSRLDRWRSGQLQGSRTAGSWWAAGSCVAHCSLSSKTMPTSGTDCGRARNVQQQQQELLHHHNPKQLHHCHH